MLILVGFIRRTTTRTGLAVTATCFEQTYLTRLRVSKAEFKNIQLIRQRLQTSRSRCCLPNTGQDLDQSVHLLGTKQTLRSLRRHVSKWGLVQLGRVQQTMFSQVIRSEWLVGSLLTAT